MAEAQGTKKGGAGKAEEPSYRFRTILPDRLDVDFVGKRRLFLILSIVLNLAAVVLFFTVHFNYGVDFTGGTAIRLRFDRPVTARALRRELRALSLRDLTVQDFGQHGKEFLLRFEVPEGQELGSVAERITQDLEQAHPDRKVEVLSVDSVGPKVANDLWWRGFWAVAFATAFMGIYIAVRFERSFGAGAVIALVHDVFITAGALMLSRFSFDLTSLAALLTVIGFSVNDTIIVYDRIRENVRRNPRRKLEDVVNQSINETLSRTLLTTGTALFVLIALFVFGGPGLRPFAFTLTVGFTTGTYSSIYIATPVVLFWTTGTKLAH